MYKIISTLLALLSLTLGAAVAQDTIRVSGTTGTTTWTSDNIYVLEGYVRVDNNETLTIEAGTVVLAEEGALEAASALIVERDGMIMAEGTADEPIIFSSILDDVNDTTDFIDNQRLGLWGGIIICGDASTNTDNNGNEQVEGIPSTLPSSVGTFGGSDDDDNSGVLRYVSIRHTGVALASNNEIQGLTLAGVGRGTTIEYVESYASADDGIEIFGGTVNMKYVAIAFAEDDMLDLDQGYTGNMQFVFIIQSAGFGDRLGEWDGADTPEDGTPFGQIDMYNMTMIGSRPANTDNRTITFRANGGGYVQNSIFLEQSRGIDVEIVADAVVGESSYDRYEQGDLDVFNNVFWNIADNTAEGIFGVSAEAGGWTDSANIVSAANTEVEDGMGADNVISDPGLVSLSYQADGGLDPRVLNGVAYSDQADYTDPFFTPVPYKGAFSPDPNQLWIKGWTALDHYGYVVENPGQITTVADEQLTGVSLYPNPTEGMITIKGAELSNDVVNISVFDQTGRAVKNTQYANPVAGALNTQVNLSNLSTGLYIVKVRQGNKVMTERVSVK